jgi:hypothetical protein
MTDAPYGGTPPTERPLGQVQPQGQTYGDGQTSTTDAAKEQATQVGQTAKESGKQVAGTAAEQGKNVLEEGRQQARHLTREVGNQVTEQTAAQKDKAATGLRSLSDELRGMANGQGTPTGIAGDLVQQASTKAGELAEWLEQRDPGTLLEEVRGLARRKPGTFLLGALAAGVVAGRLTRGAVDASRDQDETGSGANATGTSTPVADDAARAVGLDDAVALPGDTVTTTPGEYASGTPVGGYR